MYVNIEPVKRRSERHMRSWPCRYNRDVDGLAAYGKHETDRSTSAYPLTQTTGRHLVCRPPAYWPERVSAPMSWRYRDTRGECARLPSKGCRKGCISLGANQQSQRVAWSGTTIWARPAEFQRLFISAAHFDVRPSPAA